MSSDELKKELAMLQAHRSDALKQRDDVMKKIFATEDLETLKLYFKAYEMLSAQTDRYDAEISKFTDIIISRSQAPVPGLIDAL